MVGDLHFRCLLDGLVDESTVADKLPVDRRHKAHDPNPSVVYRSRFFAIQHRAAAMSAMSG